MAARLLLVRPALHDAAADGLAIADARLPPLNSDAVAIAKALGGDAQVHLALPPQHHFVGLRVMDDSDRRIFLGQPVQRLTKLTSSPSASLAEMAIAGKRADGVRRWRQRGAPACPRSRYRRFSPFRVWRTPRFHQFRRDRASRRMVADQFEGPRRHGRLRRRRRQQRRAVAGLAGENADNRHFAAMSGVLRLEHIGKSFSCRLSRPSRFAVAAIPGNSWRIRFQQPQHAVGAGRGSHQDRVRGRLAQFAGGVRSNAFSRVAARYPRATAPSSSSS